MRLTVRERAVVRVSPELKAQVATKFRVYPRIIPGVVGRRSGELSILRVCEVELVATKTGPVYDNLGIMPPLK